MCCDNNLSHSRPPLKSGVLASQVATLNNQATHSSFALIGVDSVQVFLKNLRRQNKTVFTQLRTKMRLPSGVILPAMSDMPWCPPAIMFDKHLLGATTGFIRAFRTKACGWALPGNA
jgi:hypothetical protein